MKEDGVKKIGLTTDHGLISLMNNKSEPTMDGDSLEDFIGLFSSDHEGDSVKKLKPGETPIFLAVLYFR